MNEKQATRKGCTPIYVYCLPDEKAQIEAMAKATGHSASSYLREIGQGYPVRSILDYERVQELSKICGDLGRLGGLLKLWLTDDAKLAAFGVTPMSKTIVGVLDEIRANQAAIREIMALIVTPLAAKKAGRP
jgi:hypothetical protein